MVPHPLKNGAWPAPAKINLFLHITGQREDGYHTLQTVFQLLDYYDEIFIDVRDDGEVTINVEQVGVDQVKIENNLCLLAAKKLQKLSETKQGADIRLIKRLPIGGGVGGGSSDAATTLVVLNYLWQLNYSLDDLKILGVEVGADVPVFIAGNTAWAEGVGDVLQPIETENDWYLVVNPGVSVLTNKIFSSLELTRDTNPIKIRAFLDRDKSLEQRKQIRNDCEMLVRKLYPEIGEALDWLALHGQRSDLTGTGCCVFSRFTDQAQALDVYHKLPKQWFGFVTKGLTQSLLFRDDF
jgi:4-diphosphocytidyl-2-C-methyl-D-erythritol kinase